MDIIDQIYLQQNYQLNTKDNTHPFQIQRKVGSSNSIFQKSGCWSSNQKMKYAVFLKYCSKNRQHMNDLTLNKVFSKMSKFISTRNISQCRIFHIKMTKINRQIDELIKFIMNNIHYERKYYEQLEIKLEKLFHDHKKQKLNEKSVSHEDSNDEKEYDSQLLKQDVLQLTDSSYQIVNKQTMFIKQNLSKLFSCLDQQYPEKNLKRFESSSINLNIGLNQSNRQWKKCQYQLEYYDSLLFLNNRNNATTQQFKSSCHYYFLKWVEMIPKLTNSL